MNSKDAYIIKSAALNRHVLYKDYHDHLMKNDKTYANNDFLSNHPDALHRRGGGRSVEDLTKENDKIRELHHKNVSRSAAESHPLIKKMKENQNKLEKITNKGIESIQFKNISKSVSRKLNRENKKESLRRSKLPAEPVVTPKPVSHLPPPRKMSNLHKIVRGTAVAGLGLGAYGLYKQKKKD